MRAVRPIHAVLMFVAIAALLAVLAVTGARLGEREREIERNRASEEHQRELRQCSQTLLASVEQVKLRYFAEIAAHEHVGLAHMRIGEPLTLIARLKDGRLVLPWEDNRNVDDARTELAQPEFAEQMRRAEEERTPA